MLQTESAADIKTFVWQKRNFPDVGLEAKSHPKKPPPPRPSCAVTYVTVRLSKGRSESERGHCPLPTRLGWHNVQACQLTKQTATLRIAGDRLRGCGEHPRVQDILFEHRVRGVDFDQRYVIAPEIGEVLKHALRVHLVQLGSLHHRMAKHQATIAGKVDIDHFDVGIDISNVVLPRQFTTNTTITAFIMDGVDPDAGALLRIVMQMKHSQVSHQSRAEELTDETLVAVVGPDVAQHRHYVTGTGNVRKPFAILVVGIGDDALDVLHDREAESVGIKARKSRIVEVRLKHHIGVRL